MRRRVVATVFARIQQLRNVAQQRIHFRDDGDSVERFFLVGVALFIAGLNSIAGEPIEFLKRLHVVTDAAQDRKQSRQIVGQRVILAAQGEPRLERPYLPPVAHRSRRSRLQPGAWIPCRFPDRRHTFGHRMAAAGVPWDYRKAVLGQPSRMLPRSTRHPDLVGRSKKSKKSRGRLQTRLRPVDGNLTRGTKKAAK
jgi:hypothetical protein